MCIWMCVSMYMYVKVTAEETGLPGTEGIGSYSFSAALCEC